MENEITVLVTCTYDELLKELKGNDFELKEKYNLFDVYMIDKSININEFNNLELLQKFVIVRDIINIEKSLLYKVKKYADNGDILFQKKIKCPITNTNNAIEFMEAINYKKLFSIDDTCYVFANDKSELVVQSVNGEYLFIEMESKCNYIDNIYKTVEEMEEDLNKYNLPIDSSNYFVKKAEILLDKVRGDIK